MRKDGKCVNGVTKQCKRKKKEYGGESSGNSITIRDVCPEIEQHSLEDVINSMSGCLIEGHVIETMSDYLQANYHNKTEIWTFRKKITNTPVSISYCFIFFKCINKFYPITKKADTVH